jgi:hypothetical protein
MFRSAPLRRTSPSTWRRFFVSGSSSSPSNGRVLLLSITPDSKYAAVGCSTSNNARHRLTTGCATYHPPAKPNGGQHQHRQKQQQQQPRRSLSTTQPHPSFAFDEDGETARPRRRGATATSSSSSLSEAIPFPANTSDRDPSAVVDRPILLNSKEHAVGYLSRILNARVYEAAIETELQHAKNLSAVSRFVVVVVVVAVSCKDVVVT